MSPWTRLLAAGCLLPAAYGQLFPPDRLARIQQGLRDIYNMEYKRAAENFQGLIAEAPDDPAGYAYLASTYWIQELSAKQELSIDRFAASDFFSEAPKYVPKVDPAVEQRFRQMSEQAVEKARARIDRNADDRAALFLLGLAYQNLASFEASLKRRELVVGLSGGEQDLPLSPGIAAPRPGVPRRAAQHRRLQLRDRQPGLEREMAGVPDGVPGQQGERQAGIAGRRRKGPARRRRCARHPLVNWQVVFTRQVRLWTHYE